MREEYWHAAFWLLVIGSWVLGVAYGRWGGGNSLFIDLSQAVRVPSPIELNAWWQPLVYFSLTAPAIFVLAQLFFGVGAVVFLFSRGVYDSMLVLQVEQIMRNESLLTIPANQLCVILFIALIFVVNLPLCLWSAQLGTKQVRRMWHRLRGKPLKLEAGDQPMSNLLMILAALIAAGLLEAFIFAYT